MKVEFKLKLFSKFIDRKYAAAAATVKHSTIDWNHQKWDGICAHTHYNSCWLNFFTKIVRSYQRMHRAITFLLEITVALEMYQ